MKNIDSMGRLGKEPVAKLMMSMGIPMILSMMLQALYNIVDSAFVANMPENGEIALNALTLAFPVQMLLVAVGIGTGVGANALLAKRLGLGDRENASRVSGNAVFLAGIIYIIFLVFGCNGIEPYIASQTGNKEIMAMASDYLKICCVLSFGIVFFSIFEKLLQATGLSKYSTIAQVTGAVVNMVLDPVMIYGFFGLPALGVRGAAYATVAGQIASMLLALFFHIRFNTDVKNNISYMKPSGVVIKSIYAIGVPAIIAQALMSFMTYALNIILGRVGEEYVTAYGLYYKIQQFILFAAFGLRDAITPVVSFNYGMRSKKRVTDGIKYGMLYTSVLMLAGTLILEIFAVPFSKVFGLSGFTQEICISAIRIISLSFVFAGINIAFQGIFQALESGIESLVLSVCRQCIFVIPVAYVFSSVAISKPEKSWLIWITFLIAEIITAFLACMFMIRIGHRRLEKSLIN
ncbi:MAG: MATE family efflux transporter [Bacteroides sp.]